MTEDRRTPTNRRERRIIERPRLIKLLDESEARVILLLAPAGYGKTTLARQWAKTLQRTIWITCTPAHRDVAVLAEDIAAQIDPVDGEASRFVREFVAARGNPRRMSQALARSLSERARTEKLQWLIIDDYQEIVGSQEAELFIELFEGAVSEQLVIASRQRPTWARSKQIVYGDLTEIDRESLAMTARESSQLLGRNPSARELAKRAEGWPAVLALAATTNNASPPREVLPSALYKYFAEELFQRAEPKLRECLIELALLPSLSPSMTEARLGAEAGQRIHEAAELGFLSSEDPPELHPLLTEFLLDKLAGRPNADRVVRSAIDLCAKLEAWDGALRLLTRFQCQDLFEPILCQAFRPLLLSGRVETLSSFAASANHGPSFPTPSVGVVEAESAFRDGRLELAANLASRVRATLAPSHPLRSRASAIEGQSRFLLSAFGEAEEAFLDAIDTAVDDHDHTEALHGLASTRVFGEQGDADTVLDELWSKRHASPTHLLRATTAELARKRLRAGLNGSLGLDEALHSFDLVEDPRARSALAYAAAYALAQRAEYEPAGIWVERMVGDVDAYDLEFGRPHAIWTSAFIQLGMRRFGETERQLQTLEDLAASLNNSGHMLNARILRARLLLQTGQHDEALALTGTDPPEHVYPSWRGELLAVRALALAVVGRGREAREQANAAAAVSQMADVRVLAATAVAVADTDAGGLESAERLLSTAETLGVWDPVIAGVRASSRFADVLAGLPETRSLLETLYRKSYDLGLSRRAGFRTRPTREPSAILSPREQEVMELIARGMRNSEIARALFITPSTAKVHVGHVLEKLGVRNRAEAVARYERFNGPG